MFSNVILWLHLADRAGASLAVREDIFGDVARWSKKTNSHLFANGLRIGDIQQNTIVIGDVAEWSKAPHC